MRNLIALALVFVSAVSVAASKVEVVEPQVAEQYNYSADLDIATVISITSVPDACSVVPIQMTYEDHHGERHILEYNVMGSGCSDQISSL